MNRNMLQLTRNRSKRIYAHCTLEVKNVDRIRYLNVTISSDLRVSNISMKTIRTFGFSEKKYVFQSTECKRGSR